MEWDQYFEYSENSESGLIWKDTKLGNWGQILHKKGDRVGCQYRRNKSPSYWRVTISKKGYQVHVIIWEMFNGKVPEGFIVDHLNGVPFDNKISNLKAKPVGDNARNKCKSPRNQTGVTGVSYSRLRDAWCASWVNEHGKTRMKSFSCKKHGEQEAFIKASTYRQQVIESLRDMGYDYTERHGKER